MKWAAQYPADTAAMAKRGNNNSDNIGMKWAAQCPADTAAMAKRGDSNDNDKVAMKQTAWCPTVTAATEIASHSNDNNMGIKWAVQCPAKTVKWGNQANQINNSAQQLT
jgi:hypothetical protein